jgi:hypothetical protein
LICKENFIIYPNENDGEITIYNFIEDKELIIKAHNTEISCISISENNEYIATASVKG